MQQLKRFRKVVRQPGATEIVTFEVGPGQLSYHGPTMRRIVEPGWFDVMAGGSSADVQMVPLEVQAGSAGDGAAHAGVRDGSARPGGRTGPRESRWLVHARRRQP